MKPIEMVHREMKKNHITAADLARTLKVNPTTLVGMFERPTLQVHKLEKYCEVFNYNFFREIAESLPYAEPNYTKSANEAEIKAPLQERIKELEIEVNILRQTLKDLVSR
jgi:hypothetical protein